MAGKLALNPVVIQHRVQLRLTAAEAFEEDHRLFRTAATQDVIEERLAGFAVENPLFLKAEKASAASTSAHR